MSEPTVHVSGPRDLMTKLHHEFAEVGVHIVRLDDNRGVVAIDRVDALSTEVFDQSTVIVVTSGIKLDTYPLGDSTPLDLINIVGNVWWSVMCTSDICCPPEGNPLVALNSADELIGRIVEGKCLDIFTLGTVLASYSTRDYFYGRVTVLDLWDTLTLQLAQAPSLPEEASFFTTLAICAWLDNDSEAALECANHALELDPAYGLATLIKQGVTTNTPPVLLKEALKASL